MLVGAAAKDHAMVSVETVPGARVLTTVAQEPDAIGELPRTEVPLPVRSWTVPLVSGRVHILSAETAAEVRDPATWPFFHSIRRLCSGKAMCCFVF